MTKYLLVLLLSKSSITKTSVDKLDQCTQANPNEILMQSYVSTLKCFNKRFLELLKNEPTLSALKEKDVMYSQMINIISSNNLTKISRSYPELDEQLNKESQTFLKTIVEYNKKYIDKINELNGKT